MMLSPHFSLAEFTTSPVAARRGLDNTPGPDSLANLKHLAGTLERVRAWLNRPVIILSGYRSPLLNRAVGGARRSAHLTGRAADFICPEYGKVMDVFEAIRASGIVYDQLIAEFPGRQNGGWVHIGIADHARHQALVFDGESYAEVA